MYKKLQLLFLLFCFVIALSSHAQDTDELNPGVARLVNEGIKLHKNKDYSGALSAFEEALSIEPGNALVRQNLSIAHNNYGKFLVERTDYEKALKEFRFAIFYDSQNKIADANLDALLTERGVKANDPHVRSQLADKLRGDANFELALVEYQKALSLSQTPDPNFIISIGDIYYIIYLRDGQRTDDIYKVLDQLDLILKL